MASFLVFLTAFSLLLWSGRALPRSLGELARFAGISEFVAAFLLMAFATSIPELFIGISGAIQGTPALSLGNVLGAIL